jgi:ribonuclease R
LPKKKTSAAPEAASKKDPHAKREAKRYDNPIASREYIMEQLADGPLYADQIAAAVKIQKNQQEAFHRRLGAMERDGQIVRNRKGSYGLAQKMDMVSGRIIAHRDGFGFLVPDKGGDDVFLPERQMRSLMHGDRVMAAISGTDRKGRREGILVEVLERSVQTLVGRFFSEKGVNFVEPSNKRQVQSVVIPPEGVKGAQSGQIVVVAIREYPYKHRPAVGEILDVLGEHMAAGMEVEIAIRDYQLPHEWPAEVNKEVAPLKRRKQLPQKDLAGREDLRNIPLVTIDGEDSRDFDDAVYCEPHGKGWRLLVAIADVSAYVTPDTALDKAALERGTSVYFPDRVIPMLPEILSNQWCSLNPNVDRLCMVCEVILNKFGGVRKVRFMEAVMRSAARLTYTQVSQFLEHGDKKAVPPDVAAHVQNLFSLYQVLRQRRNKRGAIDFETTETRILYDDNGKIDNIVPTERNEAHKLIEEMMLLANVATAEWLQEREIPFLYRIHEGPTAEKLEQLRSFLAELGQRLYGGDEPQAKHYAALLDKIRARPDARMIQTVLLRSLRLAVYSPDNVGHFGLSYESYAHFTSPIRRYPDLLVHRAIRHCLHGGSADDFKYSNHDMTVLGEHCSMTERRADEATRDAVDWLKCEYMQDKIGESYDGMVTSVTPFGLFVELGGIFVEGLVHVTSLRNDYYHYDPVSHRLTGERGGKVYQLSDKIRVTVTRVNLEERKIDFVLADEEGAENKPKKKKSRRRKGSGKK